MNILDNLSEEQRKPAEVIDGAVLVTAGAGSGKTRMLTHRIAHLVESGVSPYNILAITFTNKAAGEMKERLAKMIDNADNMWVSTFHSMCTRILRRDIEALGYTSNFSIYGDQEKERTIKRFINEFGVDESVKTESISWHISNAKNNMLKPAEYVETLSSKSKKAIICKIMEAYEAELKKCNALDFDDLLTKTYELLKENSEVLAYYQNKFTYIHVDEFQDTNHIQYELVRLLGGERANIFVVGDEDQCIYSWRGADAYNVIQFTKDYKNAQVFKLEQNYRCTKKILEKANKLICLNKNRLEKVLWTDNDAGNKVEEFSTYNEAEEAEYVASNIKRLVEFSGYRYGDFAILMRVNALSRAVEEKLITYGVPYKVYGGFKFFERKEIKDTISYLRLLSNPKDDEATRRMLVFPKKGIGDVKISELEVTAESEGVSLFECAMNSISLSTALTNALMPVRTMFKSLQEKKEQMGLYDFVAEMVKIVGIKEAIGDKTDEDLNKQLNVDDFLLSVKEYEDANSGATLEDYLQSITLMRDIDNMNEEDNNVSLITVHAAKGLEFKVVFIIGLNDGLFPLSRAINSEDENELEEERRLMYVAITRAKERLYLSRARTKFSFETKSIEYTKPSRFLKECGEMLEDFEENKKSNYSFQDGDDIMDRRISDREHRLSTKINVVNLNSDEVEKPKPKVAANAGNAAFSEYKTGTRVRHEHFGEGTVTLGVTDFVGGFVTVKFDKVGIKTLSLKFAKLEII